MAMLHVRTPAGVESHHDLPPGRHTVGRGSAANVALDAAAPVAMELSVAEDGVTLVASVPVTVGGIAHAAGFPRFLRPGEEVALDGAVLWLAPEPQRTRGTATLGREILGSAVTGDACSAFPTLTWLTGYDLGKRLALTGEEAILGRAESCAARVRDRLASRRHARIGVRGERAALVDLGSANGVFVDGRRIDQETPLDGGEIIQIGDTLIGFGRGALAPAPEPVAAPAEAPAVPAELAAASAEASASPATPASPQGPIEVGPSGAPRGGRVLLAAGVLALGLGAGIVVLALR